MLPALYLYGGLESVFPLLIGIAIEAWVIASLTNIRWPLATALAAGAGYGAVSSVVILYLLPLALLVGQPVTLGRWVFDTAFVFCVATLVQTLFWRVYSSRCVSWRASVSASGAGAAVTIVLCALKGHFLHFWY